MVKDIAYGIYFAVNHIVPLQIGHKYHKFIPADPCRNVLMSENGPEASRGFPQHPVTEQMPIGIIDLFEIIHINEKHRRGIMPLLHITLHSGLTFPPVQKSGERI